MHRIIFMGTPAFAVPALDALLATQEVVGVVTQPDRPAGRGQQPRPSPVKVRAVAAGIPVYQPASLKSEAAAAPLRAWEPAAVVVAAFGQILRPHVLDLPPLGCLNVHASLLPRWRGASPIQHALLAGDEETGISLMRMDPGMDTGPVYVQESLPLGPADDAQTVHDRLAALGARMLQAHLDDILAGRISAVPQDDALATYAPLIRKEDGRLDWTTPAVDLARRVRAMHPWPGAYTSWNGNHLKVLAVSAWADPLPAGPPGQVLLIDDAPVVRTGDGGLRLERLQLAGRGAADAADFARGYPDFAGSRLGTPA